LVAGAWARPIIPGKDTMGIIATILLGVAGSILGGLVSWAIWGADNSGFRPAGFIFSLIGAVLLLWIWRMVRARSTV
jgi:uncharacterized membrane protein YeaQ/YmgE (transglycosylase-associated protein family)